MQPKHNKQLVPRAKRLRKEMTQEERHLWYDFLRGHPARFSRQKVLGKYIADFTARRRSSLSSWTARSITRPTVRKRTRSAPLFWRNMGCESFVFPTMKCGKTFAAFARISTRRWGNPSVSCADSSLYTREPRGRAIPQSASLTAPFAQGSRGDGQSLSQPCG